MRNLTRCYSEHAIKVSDSYCSGQSKQVILSPKMNMIPSTQDTVTCTYKVMHSSQIQIFVTVTWCSLMDQGFTISIVDDPSSPFKFNAKHLHFGKNKGNKIFGSSNTKIEIIWDLSTATYDTGPHPTGGFYVAILLNFELILLLGDKEQDVEVKKLISKISSKSNFTIFSRSEHFSGSSVYSTKAQFFDKGRSHDIVIKCIAEEKRQRELILSVYIDEKNVIEVKRLHWNFRGNETIYIEGCLVDMMWDVHDWFFNPKSGNVYFMFRPRTGLDCRLWLEEDKLEKNEQENAGFSLLICASKNPD